MNDAGSIQQTSCIHPCAARLPTSSFMFRGLIAPDLPDFGFTDVPPEQNYSYSFGQLALTNRMSANVRSLLVDHPTYTEPNLVVDVICGVATETLSR